MRIALWCAAAPASAAVILLLLGISEPVAAITETRKPFRIRDIAQIDRPFWFIALLASIINLTRMSEAFLLLNAHRLGMSIVLVPVVKIVMNIVYALAAYPAGALSDKLPRLHILMIGIIFLIIAMATLALNNTLSMMFIGIIAWGIYMGLTEGILSALVVDTTAPSIRATAFGIFNTIAGLSVFIANFGAGLLWYNYGAPYAFGAAMLMSIGALVYAYVLKIKLPT
jgi:MFS family permease